MTAPSARSHSVVPDVQPAVVHAYTVRLRDIEPAIWRCIEVPEGYSFWDLHVAIQDAMGWLDYHLHEFQLREPRSGELVRIGLPAEEDDLEPPLKADWRVGIKRYFRRPGERAVYLYDFGDDWEHDVQLVAIVLADPALEYPRCVAGARACPPEDCGGPSGYEELVQILADPKHPERPSVNAWLREHVKNYYPYRPDHFDPAAVVFSDPRERLRKALK